MSLVTTWLITSSSPHQQFHSASPRCLTDTETVNSSRLIDAQAWPPQQVSLITTHRQPLPSNPCTLAVIALSRSLPISSVLPITTHRQYRCSPLARSPHHHPLPCIVSIPPSSSLALARCRSSSVGANWSHLIVTRRVLIATSMPLASASSSLIGT